MKSAILTVNRPFLFAPTASGSVGRSNAARRQPAPATATGLFARLERETAIGSRPETVVFALLAFTGVAWPTFEAIRFIAGL